MPSPQVHFGSGEGCGGMGITFFCQNCGVRFEVDSRLEGKRARCRNCGQRTKIPRAKELVSHSARPAASKAATGSSPAPSGSWIANLDTNKVALEPLSGDRFSIVRP